MQDIVQQVHTRLLKAKHTLAVAESCTGGLLSSLLTQNPGSSAYFMLGIVAYSNRAKNMILGIPASVIASHGAVSRQVAERLAHNARLRAKTDHGIGITGIAGPGGGTSKKPVGTVYIAAADRNKTICKKFNFRGSRTGIRSQAAHAALRMLNERLAWWSKTTDIK